MVQSPLDARPERKWRRTLRELVERSGSTEPRDWLNRFVAEQRCRDHTLPSTICELQRTKGLRFERREIEVAGYAGEPARLTAYRVAPESISRARQLLEAVPDAGLEKRTAACGTRHAGVSGILLAP